MARSFLAPIQNLVNALSGTSVNTTPPGVDQGYINKGIILANPQPKPTPPPPAQEIQYSPPRGGREGQFNMEQFVQQMMGKMPQTTKTVTPTERISEPEQEISQEELMAPAHAAPVKVPKPPINYDNTQIGMNGERQLFDPSKPETYQQFGNQTAIGSAAGVGGMSAAGIGMSAAGVPNGIRWDTFASSMGPTSSGLGGGNSGGYASGGGSIPPPPQSNPNGRQGTHYNSTYSNNNSGVGSMGYQQSGGYMNNSQIQRDSSGYLPGSGLRS